MEALPKGSEAWRKKKGEIDGLVKQFGEIKTFRGLLKTEFYERQKHLLRGRKVSDLTPSELDEYNKTESAKNMVDLWGKSEPLKPSSIEEGRKEIDELLIMVLHLRASEVLKLVI